jgi:hypothetical protein
MGAGLLFFAVPASAGGNTITIARIHGRAEMKSVRPGARWQPARPGEVKGEYFLRTGSRSWVHLQERGNWTPRRLNRGCVDANSLVRVGSWGCGFRLTVAGGKISAVDGKPGRGRFHTVGG